jgi:tetratricopeptide (TPR) repeat protein
LKVLQLEEEINIFIPPQNQINEAGCPLANVAQSRRRRSYMQYGDKKQAIENFEKLLKLDPKDRAAAENLKQLQPQ